MKSTDELSKPGSFSEVLFGNSHPGSAVNLLQGDADDPAAVAGPLGLYTEEEKARAFELLDEVGLGEFVYRRADQLSGGQKQRVGIARSLIQDPKIILCDEPIASLDPKSSRMVMEHHAQCSHDRLRRKFFINADA